MSNEDILSLMSALPRYEVDESIINSWNENEKKQVIEYAAGIVTSISTGSPAVIFPIPETLIRITGVING